MARLTRSQRRARRQAQAASAAGQQQSRDSAATRVAQVRPQAAVKTQTGRKPKEERGTRRFISESWGELKKVDWPTQSHVIQGTLVVLIACAIVGTYIWISDLISKNVVQDLILR
jgi:preprotein translocase subunit SecE